MKTHQKLNQLDDQSNKYQYRLLADGSILDKRDQNKTVGYITGHLLDTLFTLGRREQQELLIQALNEEATQTKGESIPS